MPPEKFCAFAQKQIMPRPSPFTGKQAWRRPAADISALAPYALERWDETKASIFAQIIAGSLFAFKRGALTPRGAAGLWDDVTGLATGSYDDIATGFVLPLDPSLPQRKTVAHFFSSSVLVSRLPYEKVRIGRSEPPRYVMAQRGMKLPHDLQAITALRECCADFDATNNPAAFAPFLLRYKFDDFDCIAMADDMFDQCSISAENRAKFFTAHSADSEGAFRELFLTFDLRRSEGGQRWPIYRGLPKKDRDRLEARQRELIWIERRRSVRRVPGP